MLYQKEITQDNKEVKFPSEITNQEPTTLSDDELSDMRVNALISSSRE